MEFIKAEPKHLDIIMDIYDKAREYMRANGNFVQWLNGYPSRGVALDDMKKSQLYLCVEDEKILAVFALDYSKDPIFSNLSEGCWLNDKPYAIVRRIAVAGDMHGKGIAAHCFSYASIQALEKGVENLRLITHIKNKSMLRAMQKFGFVFCGTVDLDDGYPRMAYQYVSKKVNNV